MWRVGGEEGRGGGREEWYMLRGASRIDRDVLFFVRNRMG